MACFRDRVARCGCTDQLEIGRVGQESCAGIPAIHLFCQFFRAAKQVCRKQWTPLTGKSEIFLFRVQHLIAIVVTLCGLPRRQHNAVARACTPCHS